MKIAITSGKGGTGKTTLAVSLFHYLAKVKNEPVQLVDCDVEEPNCALFLQAEKTGEQRVNISIPTIDADVCTFCGKCHEICAFQAIIMLPPASFIEVVEEQCHGCGACSYVCPEHAITENDQEIGKISFFRYRQKNDFLEGRLKVGSALQTRVIRELLGQVNHRGTVLMDDPPGASCPVVAVISQVDYVLMVTEPTPYGLNDLQIMVETVRQTGKKAGVVVNRTGLDYAPLYTYLHQENLPVLAGIPFRREYAGAYAEGIILSEAFPEIREMMQSIIKAIGS
ncbi:MAG: P-loop NTPase [Bacteroidales bacterium]